MRLRRCDWTLGCRSSRRPRWMPTSRDPPADSSSPPTTYTSAGLFSLHEQWRRHSLFVLARRGVRGQAREASQGRLPPLACRLRACSPDKLLACKLRTTRLSTSPSTRKHASARAASSLPPSSPRVRHALSGLDRTVFRRAPSPANHDCPSVRRVFQRPRHPSLRHTGNGGAAPHAQCQFASPPNQGRASTARRP